MREIITIKMKKEIEQIKLRNKRVEIDKAWEVSVTRRTFIALITYIVIVVFLFFINAPRPFVSALVPTIGFVLSTLTLPFLKKFWIKYHY